MGFVVAIDAITTMCKSSSFGGLLFVSLVGVVQGVEVGGDRQGTIDDRVLGREVRLEEIIGVRHKSTVNGCKLFSPAPGSRREESKLTFKDQRSIRPDKHSACTSTTSRPRATLSIDGNITGKGDCVPAIPGRALDPVDCIKDGSSGTITGIYAVNTFDVVIARFFEEAHEHGLDRLCLVDNSLSPDVETANRFRVDVVLLHQRRDDWRRVRQKWGR